MDFQDLKLQEDLTKTETFKQRQKVWNERQLEISQKSKAQFKMKWMQIYNEDLNLSEWNLEELKNLHHHYEKQGSKWAKIQAEITEKQLSRIYHRNKVQIRNKFYGTIRNYIRFVIESLHDHKDQLTSFSNAIKPNTLQKIYNSEKEFQFVKGVVKDTIFKMNFQIDKAFLKEEIQQNNSTYKKLIVVLEKSLKRKQKCERHKKTFSQLKKEILELKEDEKKAKTIQREKSLQKWQFVGNFQQTGIDNDIGDRSKDEQTVVWYQQQLFWTFLIW